MWKSLIREYESLGHWSCRRKDTGSKGAHTPWASGLFALVLCWYRSRGSRKKTRVVPKHHPIKAAILRASKGRTERTFAFVKKF